MRPFRFRDDESSTGTTIATVLLGAVAGFAVGMYVAQRVGGFSGLATRLKRGPRATGEGAEPTFDFSSDEFDEIADDVDDAEDAEDLDDSVQGADAGLDDDFNGMDDAGDDDGVPLLEERVLEAFNNDPILAERAIDIGSMGSGVIELAGWVDSDDEAEHAMTLARGVPGVDTVVNRLLVDDEEREIGETIRKFNDGDPALNDAGWEGQHVGTGKRRQGRSNEPDRHADPKPKLEERWLSEQEAVRNAVDDLDGISAERRKGRGKSAKPASGDQAEPQP